MSRVAFQGEHGAFSEEAVHQFFSGAEAVPRRSFGEVAHSVAAGEVDFGMLPIENSLAGSVVGSYDVLAAGALRVIGEVVTPIHHCVLGVPGATLDGLTHVLSHPVALAQCQIFLQARRRLEAVAFYDTAGAAQEVARAGRATHAAIAGRPAAERYGLAILAADVEDRHDNQTRFLAVAPAAYEPPGPPAPGAAMKTSVLLETGNEPGALVRVLLPFAERGINLSKLESRPAEEPWTYRFFMELETDATAPTAVEALAEVRARAARVRVLGSYTRASAPDAAGG